MDNVSSLSYFVPELILTITVLFVILADIFGVESEGMDVTGGLALMGTALAFITHLGLYSREPVMLFEGMIAHDMFATFFKGFFIASTAVVILMSMYSKEVLYMKKGEYYSILLTICIGMCLVASSQNLVIAYLALETMSIGSYILAGFSRKIGKSDEAAIKYVLYGGVSTGVMLFGLSLLYGLTGSTHFHAIRDVLAASGGGMDIVAFTIFALVMVGVGYKIAAVPFHFWAPDVYEGSPTAITAYLSVASKGTGFALMIRFFYSTMFTSGGDGSWVEVSTMNLDWGTQIAILSVLTMTLGNLGALSQTNLKRLLAYSGIAHAGYLLMGVALLTSEGLEAVILYLVIYFFTNLAAFLVIIMMVETQDDDGISGVRGLWSRAPFVAAMMVIAMFSLVGLPPTAGFIGKFYLFYAVLQEEYYWLALAGVANTVVSLYFYARIIKAMFLESKEVSALEASLPGMKPMYVGLLAVLTLPVLYFGLWWEPLVRYAKYCATLI